MVRCVEVPLQPPCAQPSLGGGGGGIRRGLVADPAVDGRSSCGGPPAATGAPGAGRAAAAPTASVEVVRTGGRLPAGAPFSEMVRMGPASTPAKQGARVGGWASARVGACVSVDAMHATDRWAGSMSLASACH